MKQVATQQQELVTAKGLDPEPRKSKKLLVYFVNLQAYMIITRRGKL